ncbi:hypothetical protein Tsubulata_026103 [Turnera subulata]|uniref:Uncharacterized protein n=1 Tax=Turnera subulata TaxID=218843 RepID=A0A9Q0G5S1_9ROSI|nr:hypothetical protein Tsubulata_026103 [Turnera subulata]
MLVGSASPTREAPHAAEVDGAKFVQEFVDKTKLTEDDDPPHQNGDDEDPEEEGEEGIGSEDFSFDCGSANNGSPISADDIFDNGQIRPVFPLFDQTLLYRDLEDNNTGGHGVRKVFVQEGSGRPSSSEEEAASGPYCAWEGKALEEPVTCKKSNSTGFSKFRRLRELVLRSHSDGKDAFVFLNHHHHSSNHNHNHPPAAAGKESSGKHGKKKGVVVEKAEEEEEDKGEGKKKGVVVAKEEEDKGEGKKKGVVVAKEEEDKGEKKVVVRKGKSVQTAPSLHDILFTKSSKSGGKAKKAAAVDHKWKSYLPYRPDVVGFFASSNSMSKNVHPF